MTVDVKLKRRKAIVSVYYIYSMSVKTVLRQSNLKFRPEKTGISR